MKRKISLKKIWTVLKEAGQRWWDKDPFRESATIAYYAIFSIPALLAIILAIGSFAFGQEAVHGQLSSQIGMAMRLTYCLTSLMRMLFILFCFYRDEKSVRDELERLCMKAFRPSNPSGDNRVTIGRSIRETCDVVKV